MNYKFGIILVNFNNARDTIDCINSILKNDYKNFKIFVVDNSTDEIPINTIKTFLIKNNVSFSEHNTNTAISLIRTKNSGFAAANNMVLKQENTDVDFYWILNNDTIISSDFLTVLNTKLINEKEKVFTRIYSNTLLYYGTNIIQAVGGRVNFITGIPTHCHSLEEYNSTKKYSQKIDYPIGASIILHKQVVSKIGLMCEKYFLYYEELDWMEVAKKKNISLKIFTDIAINHREGSTTGNKKGKSFTQLYYSNRSRLIWIKKYHTKFYLFGQLISVLIYLKNINKFKGSENSAYLKSIFNQDECLF